MSRVVRVLNALSLVTVVGAVALLVWPTRAIITPTPIAPASTARNAGSGPSASWPSGALDSTAAQVVDGNLFSASRRAPTRAFVPPGMDGSTVSTNDGDASVTMESTGNAINPTSGVRDGLQLFGIVSQDGTRRALLQLPGTDAIPYLMAVGERRAGYRVVSIATTHVVVISSAGSRTLRLTPRTSPDSLENLP